MFKKIISLLFSVIAFSLYLGSGTSLVADEPSVRTTFGIDFELSIIPGTYIYYTSMNNDDLFFFEGYWWRRNGPNGWYRARHYSGPWVIEKRVPYSVSHLPSDRSRYHGTDKVRWNDARLHWKEWSRNKRWENQEQNKRYEQERIQQQKHEPEQVQEKKRKNEQKQVQNQKRGQDKQKDKKPDKKNGKGK